MCELYSSVIFDVLLKNSPKNLFLDVLFISDICEIVIKTKARILCFTKGVGLRAVLKTGDAGEIKDL